MNTYKITYRITDADTEETSISFNVRAADFEQAYTKAGKRFASLGLASDAVDNGCIAIEGWLYDDGIDNGANDNLQTIREACEAMVKEATDLYNCEEDDSYLRTFALNVAQLEADPFHN